MSFKREIDLQNSFLANADPYLWCTGTVAKTATLLESRCSDGRADWVWARLTSTVDLPSPAVGQVLVQPICSKIIAALRIQKQVSTSEFQQRIGVSIRTVSRHLSELLELELIESSKGTFRLADGFVLPAIEICSFEFKLKNWRRALIQAQRYRAFSHRVFVVLPDSTVRPPVDNCHAFKRCSVGLISHSVDGFSKLLIGSKKRKPMSDSNLIRAIGSLAENQRPARRAKAFRALYQSAK